jgi:hypothetical protein
MTQEELAERAQLSVRSVSDLERGIIRSPRKDTVRLLADALGLSDAERAGIAAVARGGAAAGAAVSEVWLAGGQLPVCLPPRRVLLVGREDLLSGLNDRFSARNAPWPRVAALHGLAGAGKSSVAAEYGYQHLADLGLAWQLPAEDTTVLAAEFARLAVQLGSGALARGGDPVAAVHSLLAVFPAPWLLIFDNVPDADSVAIFLPPAGTGHVLITSRNSLWPPDQGVEVPSLGTDIASGFLVDRTGDQDTAAARDLADELGGLPLALEQAGAYIQATDITLSGYLGLLRERSSELLRRGKAAGHPHSVAATLALALTRVEQDDPAAHALLQLLAFLAPDPVPLGVLLSDPDMSSRLEPGVAEVLGPLLGDQLAVGDAMAALRRYSLLIPAGPGMALMHRLVKAVTVDQLSEATVRAWQTGAAALVAAAIPEDTTLPASWPICMRLLPHARATLDMTSRTMTRIAVYLGESGNFQAARDLFEQITQAWQNSGLDNAVHADTLAVRRHLANYSGLAGDAVAARDQLAALLPAFEHVLGTDHPETLALRSTLARWTGKAGDPDAARDQLAALVPKFEHVSGRDHPPVLLARALLAGWTAELGDPAAARDEDAALLQIQEQVLGADHMLTLELRLDLAAWTGEAGDPVAARDQCAALLPAFEQIVGAEHPNTLVTRRLLAHWTGEAGDPASAQDQCAELLPICEKVLGITHPWTLTTRAEHARWADEAVDSDTDRAR